MPQVLRAIQVSRPQRLLFNTFGNECASIIESLDWSKSSLGNMDDWSQSFHVTLGIVMNAMTPMFLFWGSDHLCFYNDTAKIKSEVNHPFSLGKKAEIVFARTWHVLKPRLDRVLYYGESICNDGLVHVYKTGNESAISTSFSYSPVYNEFGKREGVLITGVDQSRLR